MWHGFKSTGGFFHELYDKIDVWTDAKIVEQLLFNEDEVGCISHLFLKVYGKLCKVLNLRINS